MQISEFRDLLANDGFAATFQTMGQYRTELLRALDGLRAQADARPVARWRRNAQGGIDITFIGDPYVVDEAELFTHPEASAPGLSVEDAMRIVMANWGDKAAIEKAFAANLTRASAATVAEPSDAVLMTTEQREAFDRLRKRTVHCPHTYLFNPSYGDMICKHCGLPRSAIEREEKRLQAAQQQAEPGADERAEEAENAAFSEASKTALTLDVSARHGYIWNAALLFAAQSVQRAGVAEPKCVCGEPSAEDVVHRQDGPCHQQAEPSETYDSNMRAIAQRNLLGYLRKASFATNVDRQAAINCVEVLSSPAAQQKQQQAEPGADESVLYVRWFQSQQGTAYESMFDFARAAWMHRAAQSGQRAGVAEEPAFWMNANDVAWLRQTPGVGAAIHVHRSGGGSKVPVFFAAAPTQQQRGE